MAYEKLTNYPPLLTTTQVNGYRTWNDVNTRFASEIAGCGAPENWAPWEKVFYWLKQRCINRDFSDLHVGDSIMVTAKTAGGGYYYYMLIMNMYQYNVIRSSDYNFTIDFMSWHVADEFKAQYNTTATNSGITGTDSPYLASNIYNMLKPDSTLITKFIGTNIQKLIADKYQCVELRPYNEESPLASSTGSKYVNIGKFWLPTEVEVFGSTHFGTPGYSAGFGQQYPLFANGYNYYTSLNLATNGYTHPTWLLQTVMDGSTTDVCCVTHGMQPGHFPANTNFYLPLCFRIDGSAIKL